MPASPYPKGAAAVQQLMEEPGEILGIGRTRVAGALAGVLHSAPQVARSGVAVLEAAVVQTDAGPKSIRADDAPNIVQHLRAALIYLGAIGDHLAEIGEMVMHDGRIRMRQCVVDRMELAAFNAIEKGVVSILEFLVEQREVGGEAFAQPDVVPILLRRRIAEPLVRHLVRDQLAARPGVAVAIEDG